MIKIQINHQSTYKASFDIPKFVEKALLKKQIQTGFFEFSFVDEETILTINKTHLNHDYVTDIITFNLGSSSDIIGDVYICTEEAKRNAKIYDHSMDTEIQILILHGILHLLDYTDDTPARKGVMTREQNRLLHEIRL